MMVVLDTNILVSALLSPFGPPARVLDLVLAGELRPAFDDRLLTEYRDVLARPRFGFDPLDVAELLEFIEALGLAMVALLWPHALPDPDDLAFVEVAAAASAILITGKLRHFPADQCPGVTVLGPAEFLQLRQDHPVAPR
jgi:putative PIN family toxin of toxin-antitoxin system